MEEHYSTFTLDLYWVGERDPALVRHLEGCDQCRAYVAHLDAVSARPFAVAVERRRWWPALALALAIVALVLWLLPSRQQTVRVAAKSAPAVQVLVHRGAETSVWDSSLRVRERDALALRVACETMAYTAVLVSDHTRWKTAFAGACRDEVLPFTLVVDNAPGDERISVVLSKQPLDDVAAQHAADHQTRSADAWALDFVFAKEITP